jgi:hypothetical protein
MYLESKAEVQLCMALLNMSEPSFTIDDLQKFGELIFKDKLEDWSEALQSFSQQDFIRADEGRYSLTEIGKKYVERVVTYEVNGKILLRKIHSLRDGSADFILEW